MEKVGQMVKDVYYDQFKWCVFAESRIVRRIIAKIAE